ncbi:transposase [Lentibacillus sp. CBA3610]|uniref:transposase n=1 Tax=Lentibacillus sp. CBA3610 TaxID=2518176 RepID=UPI00159502F3|nr:transposase [Lentibacillus sp. CBA3610]QKY70090.1 transposase [Lentibacillus sp. CBA3610]
MARRPRKRSTNGIYHIMLRGINQQVIFEDREDRVKLLRAIGKCKVVSQFELYAYCLMDNHVHLLIKETDESVSKVIQRICTGYVLWYNDKYERNGHLFQDRFKSETVEYIPGFMRVLRYIHQNPVKAGMVRDVSDFQWTSFHEYLGHPTLVDTEFTLQLFSPDKNKALRLFSDYMRSTNNDEFLDSHPKIKASDQDIISYLEKLGLPSRSTIQQMEKRERDALILELKKINGVSIRQLARVTGIPKSVIGRVR